MKSIRARLLIALLVLVALVSGVAGVVTYRRVLVATSTLFDYQLRQMALSLRSQVTVAPRIEVPPDQGDADFVIQIWDLFGARVYLSRPGLPVINRTNLGYANLILDGREWRSYGLQTNDGVIQIAQPVQVRETLARTAALRVLIPLALLVPILFVAVAWVVRVTLLPLRNVASEVQRRDARSLVPLPTETLPAEVEPLIFELNRLLVRLQGAFATQRAFISDAAHELRSPLTALRLQLQLLNRATDESARQEAQAQLGAAIERAIHLAEQLLTLARSEPEESPGAMTNVELAQAARQAITDSHAIALERNIDLGLDAQAGVLVRGSAEDLRTLTRNIVDNAVRYTPSGGTVRVVCKHVDQRPRLEVSDTGPGIPEADRARVFDRFYRRPDVQAGGSGLGLAIVQAIAERHGATIVLNDAQGQVAGAGQAPTSVPGLRVTVSFPPPA